MPAALPPKRIALLAGVAYVLAYVALTTLFPRPARPATRVLICGLWLVPPALLAFAAAARRARAAFGAERLLWTFLAGACALHSLAVGLFFARGLPGETSALVSGLGLFAHHGSFVLLAVGLLVRPDRPRGAADIRLAAHDALAAGICAAFLVAYFVVLPPEASPWPSFVLYTLEDVTPAVLAAILARRVAPPDHAPYRLLAFGLGLAAALSIVGNWRYVNGSYQHYGPLDVAWIIPYWAIAVAASEVLVPWRSAALPSPDRARGRLAGAALVLPPLVDLGVRSLGLSGDAEARTLLSLSTFAALALLGGVRLRPSSRPASPRPPEPDTSGSPELMRLASGAAHELNNPLMAVVVSSELAIARGGDEAPLRALQAAVHDAAAAIRRFQVVASGSEGDRT
jgi:hypothetical protein